MDVAQRVAALAVGLIGLPAVVDADARVGWQDADGVGRFATALRMDGVVGEPGRAGDVRPGEVAAVAHAGLVTVQHRHPAQRCLDRVLDGRQRRGRRPHPHHQGAARQVHAEQVTQQGLHPRVGHQLLLDQIDHQRPELRAILRPAGCLGGKRADAHGLAGRTPDVQRLVLGDLQPQRG